MSLTSEAQLHKKDEIESNFTIFRIYLRLLSFIKLSLASKLVAKHVQLQQLSFIKID
jgi:hypothetical protein